MQLTFKASLFLSITCGMNACRARNYDAALSAEKPALEAALAEEFDYLARLTSQDLPSLESQLYLKAAYQARFGRDLGQIAGEGSRAEIETHFGPSDYMEGKFYIDFSASELTEKQLINFTNDFLGDSLVSKELIEDHVFGYRSLVDLLEKKPAGLNSDLFKLDPEMIEKLKNNGQQDTAPGFRDEFGTGLQPSPGLKGVAVRGRLTRITDRNGFIWEVGSTEQKRARGIGFKMNPRPRYLANVFHKFVRYLANARMLASTEALLKLKNPHLREEQLTSKQIARSSNSRNIRFLSPAEALELSPSSRNEVLIIPDLHNSSATLFLLRELIASKNWNWIGLEAPADCQPDINNKQPGQTPPCIGDFLDNQGSKRRVWFTDAAKTKYDAFPESFFVDLLDYAKSHGVSVYFNDANRAYKGGWPFNDLLAFKTRNFLFATKVPKTGSGIIFGGLWHFNDSKDNVQDFLPQESTVAMVKY